MSIKQIFKRKAVDMKSCAIIGHRKFQITKELECNLNETLNQLIVDKGVETFLFGSRSQFTDLCYKIVSQLKKENLEKVRRLLPFFSIQPKDIFQPHYLNNKKALVLQVLLFFYKNLFISNVENIVCRAV